KQDMAVEQLVRYFERASARAEQLLGRHSRTFPVSDDSADATRAAAPDLADRADALTWARAERMNMLACWHLASITRREDQVVALTAAIAALLRHDGPWAEAIAHHDTVAQQAHDAGNQLRRAHALTDLGILRRLTCDYPASARVLREAVSIYSDL